jgi:predicted GTPase
MKLDRFLRLAIGILVVLIFIIAIAAMLFVTESALNVWDRLVQGPRILLYGYVAVMVGLVIVAAWLVIRLVVRRKPAPAARAAGKLNRTDIEGRIKEAEAAGVDVQDAQAELRELASRQSSGSVHLCFFGEVSTGKSSLIKALVPEADVVIDAVAGSTTDIRHYRWRDDQGTQILLTDVPGTGGHTVEHEADAAEEARRAQIVVFVCDGDLTRAEADAVRWLLELDKPLVLVLNKSDRYSSEEQALLMRRLLDQLSDLGGEFSRPGR